MIINYQQSPMEYRLNL